MENRNLSSKIGLLLRLLPKLSGKTKVYYLSMGIYHLRHEHFTMSMATLALHVH